MGRQVLDLIFEHEDVYFCRQCGTHLTRLEHLYSKNFTTRNRQAAYLFTTVYNVTYGQSIDQKLQSGVHRIKSVYCAEESC